MISLLVRPAQALREVPKDDVAGSLWRRPLVLALAWGVMTSAFASGRLSVRLIADGAVSFAFVPLVQVIALALVLRVGRRRVVPFAQAVDVFFAGNAPWLLWMAVQAAVYAVVSARDMSWWSGPLTWSAIIPAAWVLWIDVHFFEAVSARTRRGAVVDALAQRALGWTLGILYFYGFGIYSIVVSWLHAQEALR